MPLSLSEEVRTVLKLDSPAVGEYVIVISSVAVTN